MMDRQYDEEHADAFMETGYWGRKGAGCVVFALSTGRMLLAHRSEWVLEPHTWGTWGGAIDPTEDPQVAALRELAEESGFEVDDKLRVIESHVFDSAGGDFRYHNFIVVVDHEFTPELNWESQGSAWVAPNELPANLHPGLQAFVSSVIAKEQLAELTNEAGRYRAGAGGAVIEQPITTVERFKRALQAAQIALADEPEKRQRLPKMG